MPSSLPTGAATSGSRRNISAADRTPRMEPSRSRSGSESTTSELVLPASAWSSRAAESSSATSISDLGLAEMHQVRDSLEVARARAASARRQYWADFTRGVQEAASAASVSPENITEALNLVSGFGAALARISSASSSAYQLRHRDSLVLAHEKAERSVVASRRARGPAFSRRAMSVARGLAWHCLRSKKTPDQPKPADMPSVIKGRPIKVLLETGHRCTTEDYLSDFKLVVWTDDQ